MEGCFLSKGVTCSGLSKMYDQAQTAKSDFHGEIMENTYLQTTHMKENLERNGKSGEKQCASENILVNQYDDRSHSFCLAKLFRGTIYEANWKVCCVRLTMFVSEDSQK